MLARGEARLCERNPGTGEMGWSPGGATETCDEAIGAGTHASSGPGSFCDSVTFKPTADRIDERAR
jgi:hypothetical protein